MSRKWIAYRNGEVCGVFQNRKNEVKWLKDILKQTLSDFSEQDKTDEFDYAIDMKGIIIKPVHERSPELGL